LVFRRVRRGAAGFFARAGADVPKLFRKG